MVVCLDQSAYNFHMDWLMPLALHQVHYGLPLLCQLTQIVLKKRPLYKCCYCCRGCIFYIGFWIVRFRDR